jgi:putative aldouronate transport system permease protein
MAKGVLQRSQPSQWGKHLIFIIVALACIVPLWLVISISITNIQAIYEYGYSIIPRHMNWDAYAYIFADRERILRSYGVTIFVTAVGGLLSITILSMLAYPLSRTDYKYKNSLNFLVFFTMLFNGGLIPTYIVVTQYYHLKDSVWALILPYLVVPWYALLLRTFFTSIPKELIEAAHVDGCSEFRILWGIIVPISKPAIATVGLLCVLKYWNDWYLSLLYIDDIKLVPLQLLLRNMINNIQEIANSAAQGGVLEMVEFPSESARMAMAVVAAGPMLFIFTFFQKYFVKGLTVGAIKG